MKAFFQRPAGVNENKIEISISKDIKNKFAFNYKVMENKTKTYTNKAKMQ